MIQKGARFVLVAALSWPAVAPAPGLAETPADIQATRETLSKWLETQQVISKERQDWELGKEVLEQRISLVEGEVAAVEDKIAKANEQIAAAEARGKELGAKSGSLEAGAESLEHVVAGLEAKVTKLLPLVPDPLRERVAPLTRRIPTDPGATKLSLSERFQNVIGVLNEFNKFNQEITVVGELHALPGGRTSEVQTMYVGMAQAYFVTPDGETAGVGRPSEEGWIWTPANEIAGDVSRAIAILESGQVPAYVSLPVEIR